MLDLQEPAQQYLRSHDVLVHEKQIQRLPSGSHSGGSGQPISMPPELGQKSLRSRQAEVWPAIGR